MYGIEGLLAGRTLVDRYRIDEVIGRGGMGAVYRGRDLRLHRDVAVKVISVATGDAEAHRRLRARFQREARAAAGLHHPNLVPVYDYGTDEALDLDFLVMELLRGEDLARRLARKGPPAVPTALHILYQAARGLAAGHRAGLVHRDVKPGNLFLEPGDRLGDVQVRVLDFGIAEIAVVDEHTMTHLTVAGRSPFSPAYAAPEQLLGETGLSPATDVFSLGAVGFHLLTGRRAFNTHDVRDQTAQIAGAVRHELARVDGLPTAVRVALERALARSPRERFPNAGAFAEAIAISLPSDAVVDKDVHVPESHPPMEDRTLLVTAPPKSTSSSPAGSATRTVFASPLLEVKPAAPYISRDAPADVVVAPFPAASPLPQVNGNAPATSPPREPEKPRRRPGRLRELLSAAWSFLLTTASFVLFAAVWFIAVTSLRENDFQAVYLAAASSVVVTPFALHRLMGSRGSLRFALFASIIASLATIYLVAGERRAGMETVLATLFMAQLLAVVLAEIVTPRRTRERPLEDDSSWL